MERNQQEKMRREALNSHQRPTHEELQDLLKKLQKIMDRLGYRPSEQRLRAHPARCQAFVASESSDKTGVLNVRTDFERYEVPVFNTYEEFHKTVLRSFENISIVLNIEGTVVFISQNVSPLLGHCPEDIVGTSLLNILLNEEKEEISQKIVLNLPLAKSVGRLIEFCCYVRRGNACQDSQQIYGYRGMHKERNKYEYVKFILYLQDSYDESFVFFGNYGPNSRNIWSSTRRLLWDQQYYLVGTISVLRKSTESEHPIEIEPPVIVLESDDDSNIEHHRLHKRRRMNKTERSFQAENVNMERPESPPEVEIIEVRPAPQQMSFELIDIRTPSQSSTCTNASVNTSTSTTTSNSSTDFATAAAAALSSPYMVEPKNKLEPMDIEFEVGSEFLLSDSQDELASSEHGEYNDENVKKSLEELKASSPKEHGIETPGFYSDEDFCIIVEDTEDQKDPKIPEVILDQGQRHQKTVETAPKCPSTVVQPVRPEAVVEPMIRKDLPACDEVELRPTLNFEQSPLGERFDQFCGPQVRTQAYDLNMSRSFEDELPSYRDIGEQEMEREQCEYELAQHTDTLCNLPYEQPMAQQQMEQGQENPVYRPPEQVVTVINDLGPLSINFFGNENSEYPQSETHRFWDGHVDHTPQMLHILPSTRSLQTTPVQYQPVAVTHPQLVATNHPLTVTYQSLATVSHHPSTMSHFVSSDYRREDGPHFVHPNQGNSGYFLTEEDIDPHP